MGLLPSVPVVCGLSSQTVPGTPGDKRTLVWRSADRLQAGSQGNPSNKCVCVRQPSVKTPLFYYSLSVHWTLKAYCSKARYKQTNVYCKWDWAAALQRISLLLKMSELRRRGGEAGRWQSSAGVLETKRQTLTHHTTNVDGNVSTESNMDSVKSFPEETLPQKAPGRVLFRPVQSQPDPWDAPSPSLIYCRLTVFVAGRGNVGEVQFLSVTQFPRAGTIKK